MKLIHDFHRVAEFFFLFLGSLYLASFLAWKNGFYPYETEIFLRLVDLPIAFFGIMYGALSLRLSLTIDPENEDIPTGFVGLDLFLILGSILAFASILYVDVFIPNQFPFPKWN